MATVPSRSTGMTAAPEFRQILAELGQARYPYPEPLDAGTVAARFASVGLALREDSLSLFARDVTDVAGAELVVRSFYAPGVDAGTVERAVSSLCRRVETSGLRLAYPIRRLVAAATTVRPGGPDPREP